MKNTNKKLIFCVSAIAAVFMAISLTFILWPGESGEAYIYGLDYDNEDCAEDDYEEIEHEDEPGEEDLLPPENAVAAMPAALTVYVNLTSFLVPAYHIEGQYYFYLRDIAYLTADTHARFDLQLHSSYSPVIFRNHLGEYRYMSPFDPTMWRGMHYEAIGIELRPLTAEPKYAVPIAFGFHDQNWLSRGPFGTSKTMYGFDVDNRLYADLRSVGHAMGFEVIYDAQGGTFHINTFEPVLSVYGRQVVEDFINQYSILNYEQLSNDNLFVQRYDLFNLDNSGIPAIVVHLDIMELSRWGAGQFLYVYNQGGFERIADIGLHIFSRSRRGEIFLYSGDLGHYSGTDGGIYSIAIGDGLHMKPLYGQYAPSPLMGHVPGNPDILLFPLRPFTLDSPIAAEEGHLIAQIRRGDFSTVRIPEGDTGLLELLERFHSLAENLHYEWVEADITGNGVNELILHSPANDSLGTGRIVAIFSFDLENQETELVYEHSVGLTRALFLSANGNLIWRDFSSGPIVWDSWSHVVLVEDECSGQWWWNRHRLYTLRVHLVAYLHEKPDDWLERNPHMPEEGIYFHRISGIYGSETFRYEELDESQFLEMFKEMTGFAFSYVKPNWMQWH